jgi:alkane 1-monooxygenase
MLERLSYWLAFVLPLSSLSFLLTGAHGVISSFIWTTPFWLVLLLDWRSHEIKPKPSPNWSPASYDAILYSLSVLQFVNIALMLNYVSQIRWETGHDFVVGAVSLIVIRFLVGTSSGTSGIVVAHELIHRPQSTVQFLGRLLLYTVCYEHFVITHKRGHHESMGLSDDIATARLGESFNDYWRRVCWGHVRYAWHSEQDRLGVDKTAFVLMKIVKNQVFQGFLVELAGLVLIVVFYGWLAAFMFLYQALAAVRILEAVNYFQHWGLEDPRYANTYGWVNYSQMTRYALIGLSHHIGHHENEQKRFYQIGYSDQGPKMPYGYFVMNFWVKIANPSFQKAATRELERYCSETRSV